MEVATCVVGSVVLYFVRFPFLTMPVAITLWLMSMDLTAVFYSKSSWYHNVANDTTRPTTRSN
jgi:CBS-domain-containing membrane protein